MSRHPDALDVDPVVDACQRDVDRTLFERNLCLTPLAGSNSSSSLATSCTSFGKRAVASGGGTYERLLPASSEVNLFGHDGRVADLESLIQLKRGWPTEGSRSDR